MICERCQIDMEQYRVTSDFGVYEDIKNDRGEVIAQQPHNPNSVYVCPGCGKMEFNIAQMKDI